MADFEEELLDDIYLPSADFNIDISDDENEDDSQPLQIFTRSTPLNTWQETGDKDIIKVGGASTVRECDIDTAMKDMFIEDIEQKKEKQDHKERCHIIPKEAERTKQQIYDMADSGDQEWNEFRSQFESVLESSEVIIQQSTIEGHLQKLKEDLLINALEMLHPSTEKEETNWNREVDLENDQHQTSPAVALESFSGNDISTSAEESSSYKEEAISKCSNGSGKRSSPGRSRKTTVLHSSRFDRLSESDLDIMLEAIKEESRESSISPSGERETREFKDNSHHSFQWHSIPSSKVLDNQLMQQLESISSLQVNSTEMYQSFPTTTPQSVYKNPAITRPQQVSSKSDTGSVYLDLRPPDNIEDNMCVDETSESAKRLMKLRTMGRKSSSEDSEDNNDPYIWQQERQKYKTNLTGLTIAATQERVEKNSFQSSIKPPSGKTSVSTRQRQSSSGSFSEDDVFEHLTGIPEPSSHSEREDESSPKASQKRTSGKTSKKSKKKKRRGRGQKGSGSGSDSESKGSNQHEDSISKNSEVIVAEEKKSKRSTTPPIKLVNKHRKDSLTLSSDEELVSRDPSTTSIGRSLSSEGEGEIVTKDLEKMKYYLQRRIESRKPPSLFDTPNTSPIFHQDISFSDALPSTYSSLQTLLMLPLTENGVVDLDTLDLPSNNLDHNTIQLLHILLLTWMINLTKDQREEKEPSTVNTLWRPFCITCLQQTIVDGLAYVIAGIANTDSLSTKAQVIELLKNSTLEQITAPILTLIDMSVSSQTLTHLQSISSIPLASIFTVQDDISLLTTPLSFYWYSFYSPRCLPSNESLKRIAHLQTTVCTIKKSHLHNTKLIFSLLSEASKLGLDIAGLRLVYQLNDHSNSNLKGASVQTESTLESILAIAFRGPNAISNITDVVGPEDHSLAVVTDPNSLSAKYGHESPLMSCVHNQYWAGMELAKWFGGRACLETGSILGVSDAVTKSERKKRQRVRFSESESEDNLPLPDDIAFPPLISNRPALMVYPYTKVILVASPLVNPLCYTTLLNSVSQTGFDLLGVKRLRLNTKRALSLNISPSFVSHFTPSSAPLTPLYAIKTSPLLSSERPIPTFPPLPSLLLILGRENACIHLSALVNRICSDLQNLSYKSPEILDTSILSTPGALLHGMDFMEDSMKIIGNFTFTPSNVNGAKPSPVLLEEDMYKVDISFVAVPGQHSLNKALNVLDIIMGIDRQPSVDPLRSNSSTKERGDLGLFELLGFKLVSSLSRFQAKQLCPYTHGSPGFQEAIDYLSGKPALLLVFRGINSSQRILKLVKGSYKHSTQENTLKSNDVICSNDLSKAFYLTSLFFIDKELFSHPKHWACAAHVPPTWLNDCAVLSSLAADPEPLLSVLTINLTHLKLLVKVLEKLFRAGFTFVGMRLVEQEYRNEDVENKKDSEWVLENLEKSKKPTGQESVAVAVCVERYNAVWYLCHELEPFILNSSSNAKALYYSPSFMAAVADVQSHFTFGVYSSSTALLKYYQISSAPVDIFKPEVSSPKSQHPSSPSPAPSPPTSPLSEDAWLILPPSLLTPVISSSLPYITILDVLTKADFSLVNLLMVQLSMDTAQEICCIIDTTVMASELITGPCLVIGVRRDNAASCFQAIISSTLLHMGIREDITTLSKLFHSLLVTTTAQQTAAMKKVLRLQEEYLQEKWM